MRVLSLFTGVGGLDLGLEQAGCVHVAGVDVDPVAVRALARNRPRWLLLARDASALRYESIRCDLVVGGPPCQPYSKAAHRTTARGLSDSRGASSLDTFLRAVAEARPRWGFVVENVPQFRREALEYLARGASALGYELTWAILDASEHGVPQRRRRLFAVGRRGGSFDFGSVPRWPGGTSGEALRDVEVDLGDPGLRATGKWANLLESVPPGHNYLWHTERGGGEPIFEWRSRFWSFLLKLHPDQPSPTITAQPGPGTGPFHWYSRRLAPAELAALQSFPPDFELPRAWTVSRRLVGNSVPPRLARAVAEGILGS